MAFHLKRAARASDREERADKRLLETELARERETSRRLKEELVRQTALARRAAELTLEARADREQCRRVLAAAVTNEKLSTAEVERTRAEVVRLQRELRESERARGEAEGRAFELAQQFESARADRASELDRLHSRAFAEAAERSLELRRLEHERGQALGRVRELVTRLPAGAPPSARLAARRAQLCLATAGFALVAFLVLFVPLVVAVFQGEPPAWPALALGMSPWGLFVIELGLLAAAIGLATWALRDLRWVESRTFELRGGAEAEASGQPS